MYRISRRRRVVFGATTCLVLATLLPTAIAADPPSHDSFDTAKQVGSLPFEETVDLATASTELIDQGSCDSAKTVWYSLTLAQGQAVIVDARGTSFSTDIAFFSNPLPVTTNCSTIGYRHFSAGADGTYLVRIGSRDASVGTLHLAIYTPGTISGRVVDETGSPLSDVEVDLYEVGMPYYTDWAYTGPDGAYLFAGLPRGQYQLEFYDYTGVHLYKWYVNGDDRASAQVIDMTGSSMVMEDMVLPTGGTISGTVELADGSPTAVCVGAYTDVDSWPWWGGYPDADGSFRVFGLPTGTYKLLVTDGCTVPLGYAVDEWYQDATDFASATSISVVAGQVTSGIDMVLTPAPVPANDHIENATIIDGLPQWIRQGLTKATSSASDPASCGIERGTVWYSYTPTEDEFIFMNAYSAGASVAVHEVGAGGSLSLVGCSSSQAWTVVEMRLQQAKTYMIEMGATQPSGPSGIAVSIRDSEGGGTLHFEPSTPCHVQCPYWNRTRTNEQKNEDACAPTPSSPEGSWQDQRIDVPLSIDGKVPYALGFAMEPTVDHDVWLCRVEPDEDGDYLVTYSANTTTQICENGVPVIGCAERFEARIEPGASYIIRVYNWSDPSAVDGTYWYMAQKPNVRP